VAPANAINATLYDKLTFNFLRDIEPVAGNIRALGQKPGLGAYSSAAATLWAPPGAGSPPAGFLIALR
jgi:hypothetical protein